MMKNIPRAFYRNNSADDICNVINTWYARAVGLKHVGEEKNNAKSNDTSNNDGVPSPTSLDHSQQVVDSRNLACKR